MLLLEGQSIVPFAFALARPHPQASDTKLTDGTLGPHHFFRSRLAIPHCTCVNFFCLPLRLLQHASQH